MLVLFLFPEASAQFASWLAGPFSSVLRMHSAVCSLSYREAFFLWPRLLIPHCKEQQLCFVCGGLCTACSLIRQSHPSLCTRLFQLLKGWLSGLLLRKPSSGLWKSTMRDLFFFPQKCKFPRAVTYDFTRLCLTKAFLTFRRWNISWVAF